MSKAQKFFWAFLLIAAGMIIGAVVVMFSQEPKKACSENGQSTQVENGKTIKTYIPSQDKCK